MDELSQDDHGLIATAEIGEQGRLFLESELGKVMLGLAENEVQLSQELLGEIDPTDTKGIVALQNNVKVGRWFSQWLSNLVQDGENAIATFKQKRET